MTSVVTTPRAGYFSDPYPIHLARSVRPTAPQYFSGTTKQILACPGIIHAEHFESTPITVSAGPLIQAAATYGSTISAIANNNIYQDNSGEWHMAATLYMKNPKYPDAGTWNVIVHANPTDPSTPTAWIADTVLVGSFEYPAYANYDGKYFEDAGSLYLIYSISLNPAQDGIAAQLMQSPTQLAAVAPTVLINPDGVNGGYNSEYYFGLNPDDTFKLIETGNITKIHGKYALAYSTGAYNLPYYKAGVAWSDTFLPEPGKFYKKMTKLDTAGIWGQPNHLEVQYLLQSQESAWPNYVADQVLAPGVPSIVKDHGDWYLYFAGYAPSDAPIIPETGYFDPTHRRPYFVRLQITIPDGAAVATTPNVDLTSWITPVTR